MENNNINKLAKLVVALSAKGLNDTDIAREVGLSRDTVTWLLTKNLEVENAPRDVKIGWRSIGVYPHRIELVSGIITDIVSEEIMKKNEKIDAIVGIELHGVPLAFSVAQQLGVELIIFRPSHGQQESGTFSTRYGSIEGKKVAIVDDVLNTGTTIKKIIQLIKKDRGEVLVSVVLVNKSNNYDIDGVPLRGVIRATMIA
ncbi:MAG: orotate phosphoribosyltransferase-like protein [Thermoplasmata archaeon]